MPNPYPPDSPPPSSPWPDNSSAQPPSTPGYGAQSTPGYGGPSTPGYGAPTPGYGAPPPVYEPTPGAVPPPSYAPPPPMPPVYAPPSYPIQPGYAPGYMQYAPVGVPAVGNSGWATASLILGLVGLCTGLAGIAAVICGHIGLNEINRSGGRLGGKGLAIAGLVMGYIEIAGLALFMLSNFVNIPS